MGKNRFTRREFLKIVSASLLSFYIPLGKKEIFSTFPDLVVVEGKNYPEILEVAINSLGGIKRFVKRGDKVVIKPNASFSRAPEYATTTHPELVGTLVKMCYSAGAKKVIVLDHTLKFYLICFNQNKIKEAVERENGIILPVNNISYYKSVKLNTAKILTRTELAKDVLEADVFINFPIAKVHNSAVLTLGIKNLMGIVWNRQIFHILDLNQCIADLLSGLLKFRKIDLIILDATRILKTNGPGGIGRVEVLNKVIAGVDPVAVDSYGATFFGLKGEDVPHLKIAYQMGLGEIDLNKLNIEKIKLRE
jgi:uncharacterized protein (DUF362 family)